MTTPDHVFKDVEMVHLEIRIFTGQRKLEPGDFDRVRPSDLPNDQVASLGSKRTVPPEAFGPLKAVRYKAEKLCLTNGVRFMGGFAIPQQRIEEVSRELLQLMVEFRDAKNQFLADYDQMVEDWIALNPQFEDQIRRAKLPVDVVRSRFHADFRIFGVTASARDTTSSLSSAPDSLLESVLIDMMSDLEAHIERTRATVNEQTLRVDARKRITGAAEKLQRFGFLTPDGSLAALAATMINAVAGDGPIAGADYARVKAVLQHMVDLDALRRYLSSFAGSVVAVTPVPRLDLAPPASAAVAVSNEEPAVPPPADPGPVPPAPQPDPVVSAAPESWTDDLPPAPPVAPKRIGLGVSSFTW